MTNWMLYGATGYTGKLILEEAIKCGHSPVIAGRSEQKLKSLAEQYGVEYIAFSVESADLAVHGLGEAKTRHNVEVVLNAAGPFIYTAEPMVTACLFHGIHYLDITGEISVYEKVFSLHERALAKNVLLMSGVGYDIVPSDCLGKYVADQLPDATSLKVVLSALGSGNDIAASAGTLKSMLEMLPGGGRMRRGGELLPVDFGKHTTKVTLPQGDYSALMIPWGDVSTAYRTTGIPDISTYMVVAPAQIQLASWFGVLGQILLKFDPLRAWLARQIEQRFPGPSATTRRTARTYIYARVENDAGEYREAWLETVEGYRFTAHSSVLAVERVLNGHYTGALTPAAAFGKDFVLEIEGSKRMDRL